MTHEQKVLALLSDGKPHTHHELYALHVIAHSRVSDLRRDGYEILQWREGDDYIYQLDLLQSQYQYDTPLKETPAAGVPRSCAGVSLSGGPDGSPSPRPAVAGAAQQLTLETLDRPAYSAHGVVFHTDHEGWAA